MSAEKAPKPDLELERKAQERALKAKLVAELGEGNCIFVSSKFTGFIAFQKPTEEKYLDYVGTLWSPAESSGIAQEQLCMDCVAYPTDDTTKAKLRRVLKAMPRMAQDIAGALDGLACGDFEDLRLSQALSSEQMAELDKKWEFGWGGIVPVGKPPIAMATDETAGTMTRIAIDARSNGDTDNGRKVRSAVLALVRSVDQTAMEAILSERPGLIIPLWLRAQELVGSGVIELGKG